MCCGLGLASILFCARTYVYCIYSPRKGLQTLSHAGVPWRNWGGGGKLLGYIMTWLKALHCSRSTQARGRMHLPITTLCSRSLGTKY